MTFILLNYAKLSISGHFHSFNLLTDKYVLSTMGVSKESISKFLIGNQFHVKLRILSPENFTGEKLKG